MAEYNCNVIRERFRSRVVCHSLNELSFLHTETLTTTNQEDENHTQGFFCTLFCVANSRCPILVSINLKKGDMRYIIIIMNSGSSTVAAQVAGVSFVNESCPIISHFSHFL